MSYGLRRKLNMKVFRSQIYRFILFFLQTNNVSLHGLSSRVVLRTRVLDHGFPPPLTYRCGSLKVGKPVFNYFFLLLKNVRHVLSLRNRTVIWQTRCFFIFRWTMRAKKVGNLQVLLCQFKNLKAQMIAVLLCDTDLHNIVLVKEEKN